MSDFELKSTSGTPGVSLEVDTGNCKFTGYSIPQKVQDFYDPILKWLTEYGTQPAKETRFVMAMEYMNNASREVFRQIFQILEGIQKKEISKVSVVWFSKEGDDDMLGLGKRFEAASGLSFVYDSL